MRLLMLVMMMMMMMMMTLMRGCSGLYREQRVTLSRGVRGYINCPAFAEPPATLIVWTKDGEVVDTERPEGGRSTDSRGTLIIEKVTINDEGLYYCSAYSPLDDLRTDYPIWVSVKGRSLLTRSLVWLVVLFVFIYLYRLSLLAIRLSSFNKLELS